MLCDAGTGRCYAVSVPFPPQLWHDLCAYLAEHPTCQVVIHQHQGKVCKVEGVQHDQLWPGGNTLHTENGVRYATAPGRQRG